jgi:mannose-6-phosphate isomerase-like protein (cupin superfamily)
MKHVRTFAMLALAFAAGVLVAHLPQPAGAAAPPVAAAYVNLGALNPADFSVNPALPNIRTKNLQQVDSTVFAYQLIDSAPKHVHTGTTEVQLILAGTGTEWLGDKQVPISPGTFLVIPPNTPHAGFTGGPFRLYTVKTPPQDPSDYHNVP